MTGASDNSRWERDDLAPAAGLMRTFSSFPWPFRRTSPSFENARTAHAITRSSTRSASNCLRLHPHGRATSWSRPSDFDGDDGAVAKQVIDMKVVPDDGDPVALDAQLHDGLRYPCTLDLSKVNDGLDAVDPRER